MGIFNRYFRDWKGTNRDGMVRMTGSILIGAAGAVTSYDFPGASVVLVSGKTGRYGIQLVETNGSTATSGYQYTSGGSAAAPWGIQGISAMYVSPTADAALTTDAGLKFAVRNYAPGTGYFELQAYQDITSTTHETHVDVNPESGAIILVCFDVKVSSVTP